MGGYSRISEKGVFLPHYLPQKPSMSVRSLTPLEMHEAFKIFGDRVTYSKVRVNESSWIASAGAWLKGAVGMGVALWHTINFTRPLDSKPGNADMCWLIHELTHVAQYEAVGSKYIGEAVYAQFTDGYDYGGMAGLKDKQLKDFNREQQGDILRDAYWRLAHDMRLGPYAAMIEAAKAGLF